MATPHPALIELAAMRALPVLDDPAACLESAVEHRMPGVLASAVAASGNVVPASVAARLASHRLAIRQRHGQLWEDLARVQAVLATVGVDVAVFKGIAMGLQWYGEGERPSADLDLFVAPSQLERFGVAVAALDPEHPLVDVIQAFVDDGVVQSIDVLLPSGLWLDLHTDPFKIGLQLQGLDSVWERTTTIRGPTGVSVRTLDRECALIQALLHAQKDRFSLLLGYADVARLLRSGPVDWDAVARFADVEGIGVHIRESLTAIVDTLDLDGEMPWSRPPSRIWNAVWPERTRLRGRVGLTRKIRTKYWIPFSIPGRRLAALRAWLRVLFPPKRLFAYFHPETDGPYLWRIVRKRSMLALQRHERNRQQRQANRDDSRG